MCVANSNRARPYQRGFTLLEVIVALVVTSLFLVMLMPAMLGGLNRVELDARKTRALHLARSKMEWVSSYPGIDPGATQGIEGEFAWEIMVDDIKVNKHEVSNGPGFTLRELTVRVMESRGRSALAEISAQRVYVSR